MRYLSFSPPWPVLLALLRAYALSTACSVSHNTPLHARPPEWPRGIPSCPVSLPSSLKRTLALEPRRPDGAAELEAGR